MQHHTNTYLRRQRTPTCVTNPTPNLLSLSRPLELR
jgi:hypothetical protein